MSIKRIITSIAIIAGTFSAIALVSASTWTNVQTDASGNLYAPANVNASGTITVAGVTVSTSTLSTSTANTWAALQRFTGATVDGTTTLASTTNALVKTDSNGVVGAYGGASACPAGNAVTTISALGATTCAAFGSSNVSTSTANTWTALQTFSSGATINGTTTLASTTNALLKTDANGVVSAYTSSTTSGAGNCLTGVTLSATGTLSSTNAACSGSAPSSTIYGAGAYLGVSGSNLTVSSTLASSTWGSFTILNNTSTNIASKLKTASQRAIFKISCEDDTGTSTFHFFILTALATTTQNSNITSSTIACGVSGNTTTTFQSSTIPVGDWMGVTSTVQGAPNVTNVYVESTIQ